MKEAKGVIRFPIMNIYIMFKMHVPRESKADIKLR